MRAPSPRYALPSFRPSTRSRGVALSSRARRRPVHPPEESRERADVAVVGDVGAGVAGRPGSSAAAVRSASDQNGIGSPSSRRASIRISGPDQLEAVRSQPQRVDHRPAQPARGGQQLGARRPSARAARARARPGPAAGQQAAVTRPLWPPPITITSWRLTSATARAALAQQLERRDPAGRAHQPAAGVRGRAAHPQPVDRRAEARAARAPAG